METPTEMYGAARARRTPEVGASLAPLLSCGWVSAGVRPAGNSPPPRRRRSTGEEILHVVAFPSVTSFPSSAWRFSQWRSAIGRYTCFRVTGLDARVSSEVRRAPRASPPRTPPRRDCTTAWPAAFQLDSDLSPFSSMRSSRRLTSPSKVPGSTDLTRLRPARAPPASATPRDRPGARCRSPAGGARSVFAATVRLRKRPNTPTDRRWSAPARKRRMAPAAISSSSVDAASRRCETPPRRVVLQPTGIHGRTRL